MKKRLIFPIALVTAIAVMLTATFLTVMSANSVDLEHKCSLSVSPGTFEDMANANLVIDLYKVADAVAVESGDTYGFEKLTGVDFGRELPDYDSLAVLTNDERQAAAQAAAASVLTGSVTFTPEADASALDCGLYLVVAHGSDLTDYIITTKSGQLATVADSEEYEYTFLPELVSLPVSDASSSGSWKYEVTASLKSSQEELKGDLEITKTLLVYEDSTPVTFVFSVEATLGDETVYSNVFSIDFTAPGKRVAKVTREIPVGAEVTVTEIYSGAGYKLTSDRVQTAVIPLPKDGKASVGFTNTYNEELNHGYGILNKFTYSEEDGWSFDNTHDSTVG